MWSDWRIHLRRSHRSETEEGQRKKRGRTSKTQGWAWGRRPPPSRWTAPAREENMKRKANMALISTLFRYTTLFNDLFFTVIKVSQRQNHVMNMPKAHDKLRLCSAYRQPYNYCSPLVFLWLTRSDLAFLLAGNVSVHTHTHTQTVYFTFTSSWCVLLLFSPSLSFVCPLGTRPELHLGQKAKWRQQ